MIVKVKEEHEVERTACDICGKIIHKDGATVDMEWYKLEYIGWLGQHVLWLCSIPCAVKWAKDAEQRFEEAEKRRKA